MSIIPLQPAKHYHLTLLIGSSVPNESSAIEASRLFATKPHLAGTPGDLTTAKDFLHLLETELGIQSPPTQPIFAAGSPESQHATRSISKTHQPRAWIDTYYPVMNTPLERTLQIVDKNGSVVWQADLIETVDETDPEAYKYFDAVPIFHGLSREGDVTGKLVDGNYCTKDARFSALPLIKILTFHSRISIDSRQLVNIHEIIFTSVSDCFTETDLKGSIVICRYGGVFRGLKVSLFLMY
jgi:N-acetylated-alpha-linked acidic dipeptidase